ncbi:MAG: glycosyltransferase family 2 protein [Candidatus Diapherotrites archaeon]
MQKPPSNSRAKKVTIALVCWNSFEMTAECIRNVLENTEYPNYEIIVIDNGSKDGSAPKLKKKFPFIRLIRNPENKGLPYAINQGYQEGKGFYLSHLNNDTRVLKGWLSALVEAVEKDSKIGIAGLREVSKEEADNPEMLEKIRKIPDEDRYTLPIGWVVRRDVIEKVGFLDAENFSPVYGEEMDWNFRCRKAGFRVVRASKANVVHFASRDSRENLGSEKQYVLQNLHRLRALLYNLPFWEIVRFFPGLALVFLTALKDGRAGLLLKTYSLTLRDSKKIREIRSRPRVYVGFKEPVFSQTGEKNGKVSQN